MEKVQEYVDFIKNYDYSKLSIEEAAEVLKKINQVEKIIQEKQKNILSSISKKSDVKKYR